MQTNKIFFRFLILHSGSIPHRNGFPISMLSDGIETVGIIYPRSLDPFHIVSYNIKWAKTSWTHSMILNNAVLKAVLQNVHEICKFVIFSKVLYFQ